MSEELRRCPFCGSEARWLYNYPINVMLDEQMLASHEVLEIRATGITIGCSNPECLVYVGHLMPWQSREEGIEAWNRRV